MTHVIDDTQDLGRAGGPGAPKPPTEDDGTTGFLGLSLPQLLGGAGAAVSSAVVASYLGVAGTLIGAALGSIVSTVSAALYTNWAETAHGRLPTARRVAVIDGSRRGDSSEPVPSTARGPVVITAGRAGRKRRLRRLIAGAVAVFVLAIGVVTAIELGLGHPVSGQEQRGGTSIGNVVGTTQTTPVQAPSAPATDAPTVSPSDGTTSTPSEPTPSSPSNDGGATGTSTPGDGATPTQHPTPAPGAGDAAQPTAPAT